MYDWLGKGIYFWEYGPQRALEWAQNSNKIKDPAVVGAVIHLGDCFDLLDRSATDALESLHSVFKQVTTYLPRNTKANADDHDYLFRESDCAVINWSLKVLEEGEPSIRYQSVRGLFQESAPVYEGSGIKRRSHIQIAVRDTACILKYLEPELSHGQLGN